MRNGFLALSALMVAACGGEAFAPVMSDGGMTRPDTYPVTLTVTVPDGTGDLYLTGNLPELGAWAPDAILMEGEGTTRTVTLDVPAGHAFEYKVTLGSWAREASTPEGVSLPNFQLLVDGPERASHSVSAFKQDPEVYVADPEGSGVLGTLIYWTDVESAFLSDPRHVSIWLPPGYEETTDTTYPVIYMSDGQNLFDPRIANTGTDWGMDEAMMRGVEAGLFEPAIIVSSWSSDNRFLDYSPWHNAPQYARFLLEEIKPRVDAEFRTRTDRDNTFHMGSSMGGLLSWYMVTRHYEHFSACGCVSTHTPLSDRVVAEFSGGDVENADPTPWMEQDFAEGLVFPDTVRMFFDYGTVGLDADYAPGHEAIRAWGVSQGRTEGTDFLIRAYEGADHNEASWRARVLDQLIWILAARVPD